MRTQANLPVYAAFTLFAGRASLSSAPSCPYPQRQRQ